MYFQPIKKEGKGYFLEYKPDYDINLAMVALTFTDLIEKSEIKKIMKQELVLWLKKYNVPTMISSFDVTGSFVDINDNGASHLIGWIDTKTNELKKYWDFEEDLKDKIDDFKLGWDSIIEDIPQIDIQKQADKNRKQIIKKTRRYYLFIFIWIFVIPISWELINHFGPQWLALIVTTYAILKITINLYKIFFGKRSKKEIEEESLNSKMRYYYYHCELNPESFIKLRNENYQKENKAMILRELDNLKDK